MKSVIPQRKQMSISSITCKQTQHQPKLQCNYYQDTQPIRAIRSPPTSPEHEHFINSPPSSPHSFDFSPPSSLSHHYYRDEDDQSISNRNGTATLQERRQRNKAASAKYRQKKNIQQNEMRDMINQISERNATLERQLREVRLENQKLRADADRLRGKCVAKKLLRQWMDRQKQGSFDTVSHHDLLSDDDLDSLSSDI
ncbi:uncharacterized protein EV154DRAFT_491546 [Mucor mucedo]|uniref:uncharacterized protein n=1 Tax=Mucor mucedo TaxID=29922 RepID=UPI00221FE924|nr:uncharacterized protein EV154DRAFT_491546 [Mucor mucedo]KAI7896600.1 hypothetical protein EV154DRAFT_491546 [Mucor mucedo]